MDAETKQEAKDHRNSLERQLRLDGQKLDVIWLQARNAVGQVRIDLHKQIGLLREQQRLDRKVYDDLKTAAQPDVQ
jgi:hypothetical protein